MKKLFRLFKNYKDYKISIRKHEEYLFNEYGLERNNFNELITTITLIDAPQDLIDKFGIQTLLKKNITEFFEKLDNDVEKLDLQELITLYEVKQLNEYDYGITVGFKQINSRKLFWIKTLSVTVSIILLIFGIKIIL